MRVGLKGVILSVQDRAWGIPKDDLDRVFDKCLPSGYTPPPKKPTAPGLGDLAIVKEIRAGPPAATSGRKARNPKVRRPDIPAFHAPVQDNPRAG